MGSGSLSASDRLTAASRHSYACTLKLASLQVPQLQLSHHVRCDEGIVHVGDSLQQAQEHKLQALVDAAGITAQDHVLEIGCGWGSLAMHAVKVGACHYREPYKWGSTAQQGEQRCISSCWLARVACVPACIRACMHAMLYIEEHLTNT